MEAECSKESSILVCMVKNQDKWQTGGQSHRVEEVSEAVRRSLYGISPKSLLSRQSEELVGGVTMILTSLYLAKFHYFMLQSILNKDNTVNIFPMMYSPYTLSRKRKNTLK